VREKGDSAGFIWTAKKAKESVLNKAGVKRYVIMSESSTQSPVHVLMLSIQAVRGLPRLRAPGIVPCIISFSRQLPCFLVL